MSEWRISQGQRWILSLGSQLKKIVASTSSKCAGLKAFFVLDVVTARAGIQAGICIAAAVAIFRSL